MEAAAALEDTVGYVPYQTRGDGAAPGEASVPRHDGGTTGEPPGPRAALGEDPLEAGITVDVPIVLIEAAAPAPEPEQFRQELSMCEEGLGTTRGDTAEAVTAAHTVEALEQALEEVPASSSAHAIPHPRETEPTSPSVPEAGLPNEESSLTPL